MDEPTYRAYQDNGTVFYIREDIDKKFLKGVKGKIIGKGYTLEEVKALKKLLNPFRKE
jgi:hypothetical protein